MHSNLNIKNRSIIIIHKLVSDSCICTNHLINQTSKVDVHANLKFVHTHEPLDYGNFKG